MTEKRIVTLLGNSGVGKTSIINKIVESVSIIQPTLNPEIKEITLNRNGTEVILQLVDTCGMEEYQSIVPLFLRNTNAVLLVFEKCSLKSLNALVNWYKFAINHISNNVPFFMVKNKNDLADDPNMTEDVVTNIELECSCRGVFETSVVTLEGIDDLAKFLIETDEITPDPNYMKGLNEMDKEFLNQANRGGIEYDGKKCC